MISVRLCEDEYQALQHLCTANGMPNLSNFVRKAMQDNLNGLHPENAQCNCMNEFEVQLSKLDQKIDELIKTVTSSLAELKNE